MEVTEVRKTGRRYTLRIGGETIRVAGSVFEERPLAVGDEVDPEEYDNWLLLRQYRPAMEYALNLLARRAFAEGELNQRIRRVGYRPLTADMVCHKLKTVGVLDDADFARQWVEAQMNRGIGGRRIARELGMKGVSREEAEEALSEADGETELAAAAALAEKGLRRAKKGEDPRKTWQRVLAQMARRGYDYETSKKALNLAREALGDGMDDGEEIIDD